MIIWNKFRAFGRFFAYDWLFHSWIISYDNIKWVELNNTLRLDGWIFFAINPQIKLFKSLNNEQCSNVLNDSIKSNDPKINSEYEIYYAYSQILYGSFYYE